MIDAQPGGPVSKDFRGRKKLIPIVLTHGLTATKHMYSVMGTEMASFGYMVILMDHHDYSCCFTPRKNRSSDHIFFKGSYPHFKQGELKDKIYARHSELDELITFIG